MIQEKERYQGTDNQDLVHTHFRWGWCLLLVFLTLGLLLEAMHAFKVGFYLDASSEARRMTWTLAHAHGTLFALIHLAFAAYLNTRINWQGNRLVFASRSLMGGSILLPVSFFLSGMFTYDGDPGLFVFLAPFGALLLFIAVFLIARSALTTLPEE